MKPAIALLVTLPFLTSAVHAVDFDVSGVKLGMPSEAAQKVLKASNPKYQITTIKSPSGVAAGVDGIVMGSQQMAEEHFQMLTNPSGQVWFVGKAQTVPKGKSFGGAQMKASLIEKYGRPTDDYASSAGSGHMRWHFDRAGKLYQGDPVLSPCVAPPGEAQIGLSVIGVWVKYPTSFNPKCGKVIDAVYMGDGATGLVEKYVTRAYEAAATYDTIVRETAAMKKQRDDAINKETKAGNKPGL